MKYIVPALLFPLCVFAQTINVDSLEQKGYHVYIHKKHLRPKVIIRQVLLRDTIWRERIVVRHDTVRIYSHYERTVAPQYVLLSQPEREPQLFEEAFTLALVGTANTNGYEMHGGATLALGKRIKFFIGAGCAYNSVLKETRLDLGGHLIITITQ
jgi:hypothetical protein